MIHPTFSGNSMHFLRMIFPVTTFLLTDNKNIEILSHVLRTKFKLTTFFELYQLNVLKFFKTN